MISKKRGLSKGLESLLLPDVLEDDVQAVGDVLAEPVLNSELSLPLIAIEKLNPGRFQPRKEMDESELESLANSIRAQGVLQPIVVRPLSKGKYEILAGERRWRASRLAGLTQVPIIVKDVSDEAALAIGLIENVQRSDLNPLEEAIALERLSAEFGLTHAQIAQAIGKSRAMVSNLLRLLTLRKDVQILVEKGSIDFGHAKVLLGLQGAQQSAAAKDVAAKDLSVRETERLVSQMLGDSSTTPKSVKPIDPDIRKLQMKLSDTLGSSVKIMHSSKGNGKIMIKYNSLDEMDGILEHIK